MKAIVIEDEINVREGFIKLLRAFCPEVTVVGATDRVETGLQLIREHDFDLLFLDINLPDGSGFDLMHRVTNRDFSLVFVTAYDSYAVDAFKLSAIDYLLKPVSPDQLVKAVQKVANLHLSTPPPDQLEILDEQLNRNGDPNNKLILKDQDSIHLIQINDILYCQADGGYTLFHLKDGSQLLTSMNLKEYEQLLQVYRFVRSHHSYLVNLHHIREVRKVDGGSLLMSNGASIPVSTRKRSLILEEIRKLFIG